MTNTSSNIGTLFVIIMGSLIGIGTIAMGITSYSINKQLDNVSNNFTKKETNNNTDDSDEDENEEEPQKDIMDDITNLKTNLNELSKYQGFNTNRDEYSLTPEEGWKIKNGGKRNKSKSKKTKKYNKRKTSKK